MKQTLACGNKILKLYFTSPVRAALLRRLGVIYRHRMDGRERLPFRLSELIRRFFVFVCVVGAAFSIIRWFLAGLIASKWIGLPQYASEMHDLQNKSRHWGIAAVVLEIVAIAISLYPGSRPATAERDSVSYSRQVTGPWYVRSAFCIVGTVGLVALWFGVVYLVEVVFVARR